MTPLDQEQDVVGLAQRLGLTGSPAEAIISYCQHQIDQWFGEAGGVSSIDDLEALVASRLNLVFEEIYQEADLDEVTHRYTKQGELVFATLKDGLTPDTYGTMIRLKNGTYVAVIDCRGDKAARRFFTRWHEIAHLLVEEDVEKQVFRATNDPLERLMDQIAGRVGFYDSIFTPLFENCFRPGGLLKHETVEEVRQLFCPHASFQATLFACQRRMTTPMVYLECAIRYREEERRNLRQGVLFDEVRPEPKLRVSLVVPNESANKAGLAVRWNMQVPDSSVIYRAFEERQSELFGHENLSDWTFSQGGSLDSCEVFVQARRVGGLVMATVQPAHLT